MIHKSKMYTTLEVYTFDMQMKYDYPTLVPHAPKFEAVLRVVAQQRGTHDQQAD